MSNFYDFIKKEAREQSWEIRQLEGSRQMSGLCLSEKIVCDTIKFFGVGGCRDFTMVKQRFSFHGSLCDTVFSSLVQFLMND